MAEASGSMQLARGALGAVDLAFGSTGWAMGAAGGVRGALARLRAEAARLASRMEATRGARDSALDAGEDAVAAQALIELARYEGQLADRTAEADARVAEWTVSPDVGAQLERYANINTTIGKELANADGVSAMNAVLKRLLGGAYMLRNEHQGIVVYFELASDSDYCDWVKSEHSERGITGAQTFV